MTRDETLLKGENRAARVPFDIYGAGTITTSWYDDVRPKVPVRLELGLGAHTRARQPWMVDGVSTWDGCLVNTRRL